MLIRTDYIDKLKAWKDEKVIKVITGIRRCGKSTLMEQFRDWLTENGTESSQIVYINFEDLDFEELLDYGRLYEYIKNRLSPGRMTYIFLDEIQRVENFQKTVDSLFVKNNTDIYITGSNAYLLSGELATLLSGRYVEINMLPFSFAEYYSLKGGDADRTFADYVKFGSFPYVATLTGPAEKADLYLEGIYSTIIIKDIEERQRRRETDANKRKITDVALLKSISKFLANSIGSPVSFKSIADYITSSGRKISQNTVSDYVEALREPYIFYSAERYDIAGKQLLKTNGKYYIADLGLRRHLVARSGYDLGFCLENVVFFELLRRGFTVNVGKTGDGEIDFAAKKDGQLYYYQVTASLLDEKTFERELSALKKLTDNYPKTVLTLDRFTPGNYDGINVENAVDWLLGG